MEMQNSNIYPIHINKETVILIFFFKLLFFLLDVFFFENFTPDYIYIVRIANSKYNKINKGNLA